MIPNTRVNEGGEEENHSKKLGTLSAGKDRETKKKKRKGEETFRGTRSNLAKRAMSRRETKCACRKRYGKEYTRERKSWVRKEEGRHRHIGEELRRGDADRYHIWSSHPTFHSVNHSLYKSEEACGKENRDFSWGRGTCTSRWLEALRQFGGRERGEGEESSIVHLCEEIKGILGGE